MTRLWLLDVRVHGWVRRVEEVGDSCQEAREIAAARYGVKLEDAAPVIGADGQCKSRLEVQS